MLFISNAEQESRIWLMAMLLAPVVMCGVFLMQQHYKNNLLAIYCADDFGWEGRSAAWRSWQSEHSSNWQLILTEPYRRFVYCIRYLSVCDVHICNSYHIIIYAEYFSYSNLFMSIIYVEKDQTVLDLVRSVDLCAHMAWSLQNNTT